MEDADLLEKDDCYAATFAFADFRAKAYQKCLDVLPSNIRAGWMGEDCFQRLLMTAFDAKTVPTVGTDGNTGES